MMIGDMGCLAAGIKPDVTVVTEQKGEKVEPVRGAIEPLKPVPVVLNTPISLPKRGRGPVLKSEEERLKQKMKRDLDNAKKKAFGITYVVRDFIEKHVCDNAFRDGKLFKLSQVEKAIVEAKDKSDIDTDAVLRKGMYSLLLGE